MKLSHLLLLPIIACSSPDVEDAQTIEPTIVPIVSVEGTHFGTLSFSLPEEMDTSFTWVDRSDNIGDAYRKYRYQSSELPVEMETGFIHLAESPDSIQRMTVVYHEYGGFMDTITISMKALINYMDRVQSTEKENFQATYDSLMINDVPFLRMESEDQGTRSIEYICTTPTFLILIESNMHGDSGFLEDMKKVVEKARIGQ